MISPLLSLIYFDILKLNQKPVNAKHTVEPLHKGHLGDRRKWPLRNGRCRVVSNMSQRMDFLSAGIKSRGCCRAVAVSGGSTVFLSALL